MEIGEFQMAQANGGSPTIVASDRAAGESGVAVLRARFRGGVHFSGTLRLHQVCFQLSPALRMERRMGGRALRAHLPPGTLSICPGGTDCAGDGDASFDSILVAIDPAPVGSDVSTVFPCRRWRADFGKGRRGSSRDTCRRRVGWCRRCRLSDIAISRILRVALWSISTLHRANFSSANSRHAPNRRNLHDRSALHS
jgi:hypothetical protein